MKGESFHTYEVMSDRTIGVDIGATKIHVGVVQSGIVQREHQFPTLAGAGKEDIIQNLIEGIEAIGGSDFAGIGIGVPGLVDEEKGIIYDLLNIASWKEVYLKRHLEQHFQKPVRITNDANVFALGEKTFGQGKTFRNMVGVTMGTGLGTGIIIDHKLYSGNLSSAGELGSILYLDKTIEDYCSGKFFMNEYNISGKKIYERAQMGEKEALEALKEYGNHLGNAIKHIMYILSPEAIFLGGSVSKSYSFFEAGLRENLQNFPFKKVLEKLVIKPSEVSNIAILGSAALIVSEFSEEKRSAKKAHNKNFIS
ncbi:ROK family protein [Salinimicrobium sp. GXAS 041]|uniref:ROK family protein n=1 Tax=Salinimicrobium sp. GXAS 041 TaxID=3400806 RepID=UPI003C78DA46